jgi:hypothetical protein
MCVYVYACMYMYVCVCVCVSGKCGECRLARVLFLILEVLAKKQVAATEELNKTN